MRIAVTNLQSGIGITRGYRQYLTSGWKYILPHSPKPISAAGLTLKREATDIALATEVDDNGFRAGFLPQSEVLKSNAGLKHYEFFPTRTLEPMLLEGNAIFSRYEILGTCEHKLTAGRATPRIMGETILDVDGTRVHVFVAHLGLRSRFRALQLREIQRIVCAVNEPVILGGDFNEREHGAFDLLTTACFKHLVALPNFPSWRPQHPLVVLFLSHHFTEPTGYIPDAPPFSDHLPLIVETELKTSTGSLSTAQLSRALPA